MNAFESKLKEFFPEIYELYLLSKDKTLGGGGEVHVLDVIEALLEMNDDKITGSLYIGYSKGRIIKIALNKDILAGRGKSVIDNSE